MRFLLLGAPKHILWLNDETIWFLLVDGRVFEYFIDVYNPDRLKQRSDAKLVFSPDWFPAFRSRPSPYAIALSTTGEKCLSFGRHVFLQVSGIWSYISLRGGQYIWRMAYSPDGRSLAVGDGRGNVSIKTSDFTQDLAVYGQKHARGITSMVWVSEHMLLSGDLSGETICWNPLTGQEVFRVRGGAGQIVCIATSRNGEAVLSATDLGTVTCFDVTTRAVLWQRSIPSYGALVPSDYTPARETFAFGGEGVVTTWVPAFAENPARFVYLVHQTRDAQSAVIEQWWVIDLAFSPSGRLLASCDVNNSAYILAL